MVIDCLYKKIFRKLNCSNWIQVGKDTNDGSIVLKIYIEDLYAFGVKKEGMWKFVHVQEYYVKLHFSRDFFYHEIWNGVNRKCSVYAILPGNNESPVI